MHALNYHALHLTRLRCAFEEITLSGSLEPFAEAIRSCSRRVKDAEATGYDDYAQIVMDSESELVEHLLGSAFVVCQVFITSVVSGVKALQEYHKASHGSHLPTTGTSKSDILGFGSEIIPGAVFTKIQVLDAFANYYKHRDEWPLQWANLDTRRAQTAAIIGAAGAKESSSGNMRAGADALGNPSLENVSHFAAALEAWKSNIHDAYQAELRQCGLVT